MSNNLRASTLRNMCGKVTQAHAFITNDKTDLVTSQRSIQPDQAQNFGTDHKGCLERVRVRFENGTSMDRGSVADCHVQTMVVRADKITADSLAVPGAATPKDPSNN